MKLVALAVALLLATSHAWAAPEDPIPIHTGQPAPADGVWLSSAAATRIAARYANCDSERGQLQAALEAKPVELGGNAWLTSGLVGLAIGVVVGSLAVSFAKR